MTLHIDLVARIVCPHLSHRSIKSESNYEGCSRAVEVTDCLPSPIRNSLFSAQPLGALQSISCRVLGKVQRLLATGSAPNIHDKLFASASVGLGRRYLQHSSSVILNEYFSGFYQCFPHTTTTWPTTLDK